VAVEQGLSFQIGWVDANSKFAFVENRADFLNSSFGGAPTAFVLPTSPDPTSSANFFLYPVEYLSFGFGLYGEPPMEKAIERGQECKT
jgi:hypothetical protein